MLLPTSWNVPGEALRAGCESDGDVVVGVRSWADTEISGNQKIAAVVSPVGVLLDGRESKIEGINVF